MHLRVKELLLVTLKDSFEESKDAHTTVIHRSVLRLGNFIDFLSQLFTYSGMQGVKAEVKFTCSIAVLFADEYFGAILELHIGRLAREDESLHTEQLVFLN